MPVDISIHVHGYRIIIRKKIKKLRWADYRENTRAALMQLSDRTVAANFTVIFSDSEMVALRCHCRSAPCIRRYLRQKFEIR